MNNNHTTPTPQYEVLNNEFNTPIIFKKKINKSAIKPLHYINNDTGIIRHYPPAAQEWFNSVYTFNKTYTKLLPVADKNLMNLLKSYFNLFLNHKVMKTKRIANRYRRLSAKKVFVGKGELKHTNNKVVVTFYVYNTEKLYLKNITNKLFRSLYYPNKELIKYVTFDRISGKRLVTYNRPFTLEEFSQLPDHYNLYHSVFSMFIIKKLKTFLNTIKKSYKDSGILPEFKVLNTKYYECIGKLLWLNNNKLYIDMMYSSLKERFMTLVLDNYKKKLTRFIYLLMVNRAKFQKPFIWELKSLVKNIYNKEVEFNIVNLKRMHLNSDIFTQAVALKLRNRDNKLFRVLRSSLSNIKLPNVSRITEKYSKFNRDEYLINKIRNTYINSMFNSEIVNGDALNNLLLNFFPSSQNIEIEIEKRSSTIKRTISLKSYILRSLKHLKLAGVRIEAKGRLTRRFTASRSVFKMKWKGGLKNVDSSFKGLSAVMLRGDFKSNVQYSMLNSKTRNGAFGVKGWVSSK
jgi:hypothetical protein